MNFIAIKLTLALLCSVANIVPIVSQTIYDYGGSLYGTKLDKRVELDTVPMHSSIARELVYEDLYGRGLAFRTNPYYTIGDVEGSVSEAQVQAAREVMDRETGDYWLDRSKVPLDPQDASNNSTISLRILKYAKRDVPDGKHIAYWALPGGPGLGSGSMEVVVANAILQNLGTIIYVPDFRGSGMSAQLRCYNSDHFAFSSLGWDFLVPECIRTDAEPNLKYMSVTNAAHDVITLMEKESVRNPNTTEVRLHAFGFSTLWAQRIMQIKGDLIDKVVLEGAVSKSFNFNEYDGKSQTAGRRLLRLCSKDEKCKQYFPNGQQSLNNIKATENLCTKYIQRYELDSLYPGNVIGTILNLGLKYGQQFDSNGKVAIDFRAFVLSITARAIRCDVHKYNDLKVVKYAISYLTTSAAESLVESSLPGFERSMRQFNPVIHNIVKYVELWDDSGSEYAVGSDEEQLFNARPTFFSSKLAFRVKYFGPPYPRDQYLVDFYPQDIETDLLVIGGELDGQTPIEYGVETFDAITVANGHHKRFAMIPTGAHIVSINSTCGTNTVKNFFADPSKQVDKCAVGDTTKIDSFEHDKAEFPSVLDARLSGSSDIWTGKYEGCHNLPSDSCSSPNVRACDACFNECHTAFVSTSKRIESDLGTDAPCKCVAQYARCMSHIGCVSNELCLAKVKQVDILNVCATSCAQRSDDGLVIASGVMLGVSAAALFASWKLLNKGNRKLQQNHKLMTNWYPRVILLKKGTQHFEWMICRLLLLKFYLCTTINR